MTTSRGTRGDKPGEFNTPPSIAADAQGNVYVADRFNRRIQIFDGNGKFLRAITIDVPFDKATKPVIGNPVDPNATSGTFSPGAPWAICITPGPNQVLYSSDAYPGRIHELTLDGKVLGTIGGPGRQLKQFACVHEIACPSENVLYVAELLSWRVRLPVLAAQVVLCGKERRFVGDRHHAIVELAHIGEVAAVAAYAVGALVGHVDLLPPQGERVALVLQSRVELSEDRDRPLPGRPCRRCAR